jgi:hypothetical protein
MEQYTSYLDFKIAYDLIRREVMDSSLTEFDIPVNLIMLNKMCLNETCSEVHIGKHLSDAFPLQNGLKQGNNLLSFY